MFSSPPATFHFDVCQRETNKFQPRVMDKPDVQVRGLSPKTNNPKPPANTILPECVSKHFFVATPLAKGWAFFQPSFFARNNGKYLKGVLWTLYS
jgi:hypothetical protein